jgi:uncharacterized protein (DUF885 family)
MLRRSISLTVLALSIGYLGSGISLTYAENLPSSAAAPTHAKHSVTAAKKLAALAERYYETQAKFEPIAATYNGDSRYDDKLPQTLNPAIKAKQIAQLSQISKALSAIRRNALSTPDQVTYDCLQFEIAAAIRMSKFDDRLMPVNQMDNVPLTLAHFASGQSAQLLKTVPQYDNYLNRIRQLPEWLQQASTNMREGMRRKIVLPKTLVISMLPQFAQLVTDQATEHPYYLPVKNFPAEFTEADKLRLSKDYQSAIQEQVLPALRRFNQFLKDEYLPASRDSTGWSALPGGAQWYQAWVEDQTTTHLTPEQIHATGLKEVARIQREYAILGQNSVIRANLNPCLNGWKRKQATAHSKPKKKCSTLILRLMALSDKSCRNSLRKRQKQHWKFALNQKSAAQQHPITTRHRPLTALARRILGGHK